tara:strand:+ start:4527 stop:4964 length:438 start_codon:yes stop_codon:yes gene_type:complete
MVMSEDQEYEQFTKNMEERFPKMFSSPYGGFAVGAGWYSILETLCDNIQNHIDWKNRETLVVPQVVVAQIKEKFGGLRFYYDGGDDYIRGLVSMAESWADRACETCGSAGKKRNGGWIRTLCDLHEEELQERKRTQEMKVSGLEE